MKAKVWRKPYFAADLSIIDPMEQRHFRMMKACEKRFEDGSVQHVGSGSLLSLSKVFTAWNVGHLAETLLVGNRYLLSVVAECQDCGRSLRLSAGFKLSFQKAFSLLRLASVADCTFTDLRLTKVRSI
jgi:hypothetical protein